MVSFLEKNKWAIVILIIAGLAYLYFSSANKSYDDRFATFDPNNQNSMADSMSNVYKTIEGIKSDQINCKRELTNVYIKIAELKSIDTTKDNFTFNDPRTKLDTLTPFGYQYLNQLSTRSLFQIIYYDGQNRFQYENIYLTTLNSYSNYLATALSAAGIVNSYRFSAFPLSGDYGSSYNPYENRIRQVVSVPDLKNLRHNASGYLVTLAKDLNHQIVRDSIDIKSNIDRFQNIRTSYFNGRFDIRQQSITWGISAFALTAIFLYWLGAYFRDKRISKGEEKSTLLDPAFLQSIKESTWFSVYMITVLLLIITIFILGLAGLLKENSLSALLGAIAGYVLNNKLDSKDVDATKNPPAIPPIIPGMPPVLTPPTGDKGTDKPKQEQPGEQLQQKNEEEKDTETASAAEEKINQLETEQVTKKDDENLNTTDNENTKNNNDQIAKDDKNKGSQE